MMANQNNSLSWEELVSVVTVTKDTIFAFDQEQSLQVSTSNLEDTIFIHARVTPHPPPTSNAAPSSSTFLTRTIQGMSHSTI